jgi:hypothetical protein
MSWVNGKQWWVEGAHWAREVLLKSLGQGIRFVIESHSGCLGGPVGKQHSKAAGHLVLQVRQWWSTLRGMHSPRVTAQRYKAAVAHVAFQAMSTSARGASPGANAPHPKVSL